MCFPQPGPRCSAHANADYLDALRAFEYCSEPTEKIRLGKILDEKTAAFNSTPRGQNLLRQERDQEADPVRRSLLTKKMVDGEALRKSQLAAYKASLLMRDDSVKGALKLSGVSGKYNQATAVGLSFLLSSFGDEWAGDIQNTSTVVLHSDSSTVKALIVPTKYQGVWDTVSVDENGFHHDDEKLVGFFNKYPEYNNVTGEDKLIPAEWFKRELLKQDYKLVVQVDLKTEDVIVLSVDELTKLFDVELMLKKKLSGTNAWEGSLESVKAAASGTVFAGGNLVYVDSLHKTVLYDVPPQPKENCIIGGNIFMSWNPKGFFEVRKRASVTKHNLFVKLLSTKTGVSGFSKLAKATAFDSTES
jgi:hypothetical protein